MKILVYSNTITPRIEYIFKWCFEYFFSSQVFFTSSIKEFTSKEDVDQRINYSDENLDDCITFRPAGLLFEEEIKKQKIDLSLYNNLPVLFPCPQGGELPFDPFSAAFYLISRYEEYLPYTTDKHGRFEAHNSFLNQTPYISIPIADHYILMIEKIIKEKGHPKLIIKRKYTFIPTIDIDIAFAYLGRNFFRNMGGFIKSFFTGKINDIFHRISVITGYKDDPYDTYLYMRKIHKPLANPPVFFVNVGDYSIYDKNIRYDKILLPSLIGKLAQYGRVGIHPSYFTVDEPKNYDEEVYRLQKITGWRITKSRQHYLRLYIPETYNHLIRAGIEEDYTMGFAEKPGFRAGTCHPFRFYDLEKEEEKKLKIFPFCIMDGTLKDYLKLNPEKAMDVIAKMNEEVRKVNGYFITLWHNESLSEYKRWQGWRKVYEFLIETAKNN
jgi:hypothetical protein